MVNRRYILATVESGRLNDIYDLCVDKESALCVLHSHKNLGFMVYQIMRMAGYNDDFINTLADIERDYFEYRFIFGLKYGEEAAKYDILNKDMSKVDVDNPEIHMDVSAMCIPSNKKYLVKKVINLNHHIYKLDYFLRCMIHMCVEFDDIESLDILLNKYGGANLEEHIKDSRSYEMFLKLGGNENSRVFCPDFRTFQVLYKKYDDPHVEFKQSPEILIYLAEQKSEIKDESILWKMWKYLDDIPSEHMAYYVRDIDLIHDDLTIFDRLKLEHIKFLLNKHVVNEHTLVKLYAKAINRVDRDLFDFLTQYRIPKDVLPLYNLAITKSVYMSNILIEEFKKSIKNTNT